MGRDRFAMNDQTEDLGELVSQLYNRRYTQMVPQQGVGVAEVVKPKRRRKKVREGGERKKRKLSPEQLNFLEMNFGSEHKLESERKDRLASELGLDPRQVAVWFQNRRARWKNKQLEDEYSILKNSHQSAFLDKCRLESEIMKLKEQLEEAKKEIQRLSENGASSNSPSSSLSVEAIEEAVFLGDLGVEGFGDVFDMPSQNAYNNRGMEWIRHLCI